MVWGLFPVDPLPGEETYYIFNKGTYKVGRKGCDIIVNKDKGVSRVHAELVVDAMVVLDDTKKKSSGVRIRDCSKYGTFVKKPVGVKEKVHEFPNKEMMLDESDLVSFGTGNATYRFSYVPLVFFVFGLKAAQLKQIQGKISSIGASMTKKWSVKCTHALLDDNVSLNADVVDAIMSKRHIVTYKWIELLAEKRIATGIPSCSSYAPTLTLQGVFVKVAESESRENCLSGYTFLLESSDKYTVKEKLPRLLEAFGAQAVPVGEYAPHSQGLEDDDNNNVVHVISAEKGDGSECSRNLSSLPKVNEINLICATLSGLLDPAIFVSPPVLVTSSCSTDETIVADSEPEVEITSVHESAAIHKIESIEDEKEIISVHSVESVQHDMEVEMPVESVQHDMEVEMPVESVQHDMVVEMPSLSVDPTKFNEPRKSPTDDISTKSKDDQDTRMRNSDDVILTGEHKIDDSEHGTSDIVFSQNLIVRDTNLTPSGPSQTNNQVLNFKRFKKMATESGNDFHNLVPFSKHPYKGSEYDNEEIAQSVKEEKKRKQRENIAEDLFNKTKAKQRGVAGFLQGILTRR
ncbi:nijmegen breakage syndrome 1 [Artemisia annua]|uniref:Nijmegen breakage syndrome 1 n=1 Tax=Artemisia annua TaxID=35608 RepID=A0A2U1MCL4_ARTAN|nr:nijmegen breakage syndrome 1 [Artemisia annua]